MEAGTKTIQRFLDQRIIVSEVSQFGNEAYALQLSRVQVRGGLQLSTPCLVADMPARGVPLPRLGKLELVQKPSVGALEPYSLGHPLVFQATRIEGPKLYMVALAMAPIIVKKPGGLCPIEHLGMASTTDASSIFPI